MDGIFQLDHFCLIKAGLRTSLEQPTNATGLDSQGKYFCWACKGACHIDKAAKVTHYWELVVQSSGIGLQPVLQI